MNVPDPDLAIVAITRVIEILGGEEESCVDQVMEIGIMLEDFGLIHTCPRCQENVAATGEICARCAGLEIDDEAGLDFVEDRFGGEEA